MILRLLKKKKSEIQRLLDDFVWEGKKNRIKNSALQQGREQGGLAFPNIWQYYQATLIENLMKW